MHSALTTSQHVAMNLGAKPPTVALASFPVSAMLDPNKRPRAEGTPTFVLTSIGQGEGPLRSIIG